MKRRLQFALAILCLGMALLFLQLGRHNQASNSPAPPELAGSPEPSKQRASPLRSHGATGSDLLSAEPGKVAPDAISAAPPMKPSAPLAAPAIAATSESDSLPPKTILENMGRTIQQYASTFGENPVGTNPEITSALQGQNPKHINFLKQDGNRVNALGELVDAWGTPYFFHQISGHEMEIRSAGPDRVMYTGDDLVTR